MKCEHWEPRPHDSSIRSEKERLSGGNNLTTKINMFVARSIAADHKDLIHDVSYDFHGRRMATCSSDQSVKVKKKRVS